MTREYTLVIESFLFIQNHPWSCIVTKTPIRSVWRAMEPAIKLASSILANMHTWEWYAS